MALITELTSKLVATLTGTAVTGLVTPSAPLAVTDVIRLTDGTGAAGTADKMYAATRTLGASGTEDLDMAGVLTDQLGQALTFARIKLIRVTAAASNTNNVQVSRPAANGVPFFLAAGDAVAVRPGGIFELAATDATAYPVTAATADLITVTNSGAGTSVTYSIVIVGSSA